jgi:hypothetical protein
MIESEHGAFMQRARIFPLPVSILWMIAFPALTLAVDSRFELDPAQLEKKLAKPHRTVSGEAMHNGTPKRISGQTSYIVRPGDHLFKILMKDYGLSNAEAEALVPEIKRLNGISNIRSLQVGKAILIPARPGVSGGGATTKPHHGRSKDVRLSAQAQASHVMQLNAPAATGSGLESVQQVWDQLVPAAGHAVAPIDFNGSNFTITLDPLKYPVFPAADGGRIVVDSGGTMPTLVKALLQDRDSHLRVVSENPANRKSFFSALLSAAKFYSVEENFAVSFGSDPQLTVKADYKIEKNNDSLLRQDVVLLNVGDKQRGMPAGLSRYLEGEGFKVVESSLPEAGAGSARRDQLFRVAAQDPRSITDGLLKALSVPYEADHDIAVFDNRESGVTLNIKADRYFEDGGQRFVVSRFTNDPVNYTLTRLLETRGYRVIVLEDGDSFRKVSEKLLARLRIPGSYARQPLWSSPEVPYSIQMSGIMLRNRRDPGRRIFLTDRELGPLMRDLADFNGYDVLSN